MGEKEAIKKYKNQGVPPGEGGGGANLIDIEEGQNKTQLMLEEEQNLEYLQERERSVAQLEADIGDVNQIFKDLAAMVHDQGEMVESIEANVESSAIRVNEGSEQLRQAERYQTKARRKKLCLAIIGFIILAIIIGLIAGAAKKLIPA